MNATVMLTAVGVIVSALFTYLAVVRRLSGRVATTDAALLWDEAKAMRVEFAARILSLEATVAELRVKVAHCEEENTLLRLAALGRKA